MAGQRSTSAAKRATRAGAASSRSEDDPRLTQHDVTVTSSDVARIAPKGTAVETVVQASFEFLLEREPADSIMRSFELPVIGRYFPGYEAEVRRRLDR